MDSRQEDKERKRVSMLISILLHVAVIVMFLFVRWTVPDPWPPEREGTMIELGWTDDGSGDIESEVVSPEEVFEEVSTEVNEPTETVEEVVEDVVTADESEIAVPDTEESTVAEEQQAEEVEPDPQPSQDLQDAMDNVFSTPSGGGAGPGDEPGNTGDPTGSPDGKGVMGGSGNGWELTGRGYEGGATVADKPTEEGKVVLNIWVGRDGKVSRATPNLRESNTTSQYLFNLAKKAAMNARFNADAGAAVEQKGKLTFFFVLE